MAETVQPVSMWSSNSKIFTIQPTDKVCQALLYRVQNTSGALNSAFTSREIALYNTHDLIFHGRSRPRARDKSPEPTQIITYVRRNPQSKRSYHQSMGVLKTQIRTQGAVKNIICLENLLKGKNSSKGFAMLSWLSCKFLAGIHIT